MKSWLPLMIQTIALLGGGLAWSTAQEHRITIIEESQKNDHQILEQLIKTQQTTLEEMRDSQQTLTEVVTREEFWHGNMSADELDAFYHRRNRAPRK